VRKSIKKRKKISETGWESREWKIRGIWKWELLLALRSDMRHFPYSYLGLSNKDNSVTLVSQIDTVTLWIFSKVFSYRCVLHYFVAMPVGFNFKVTFGTELELNFIDNNIYTSLQNCLPPLLVKWLIEGGQGLHTYYSREIKYHY